MRGGDDVIPAQDGPVDNDVVESEAWDTFAIDRAIRSAFAVRPRTWTRSIGKLVRYGTASAIALGISELALLIAAAAGVTATVAAVIGTVAGIVPSYFLSRYWIWSEAPRTRVGRQVVQYWMTSLVSLAITSLGTGGISAAAPSKGTAHLVAVGAGFLGLNFVTWIGKYVVYERFIFVNPSG